MSKIYCLANNSPEIKKELGKIVPRRFTQFAETWYYSIPDAERERIEENWTTLKKAILEYWMNHHWLEKQKLRANRARFREAGHQQESPSEYVIRKMALLTLVYSYNQEYTSARFPYRKANVNLVGWSKNIGTPSFPKDDSNISLRKTPDSVGMRPCRHCGSRKHWDNEC